MEGVPILGEHMPGRDDLQARIVERAMRDPAFRSELGRDPKGAIERAFHLRLPADLDVAIVEETEEKVVLVLPPSDHPID
jgi:hypothetical protein